MGRLRLAFAMLAVSLSLVAADATADADAHPWLGVALEADQGGPGARVGHVVRGSPADKAGIRQGDRILRVGSTQVQHPSDVVEAVGTHAPGESIPVAFTHAGVEKSALAILAHMPSQDDMMRMDLVGAFAPTWRDVQAVKGTVPSSIAGLRGRVVLVDFWATWCVPCRIVMPKLSALQARYGAQGLTVVGLSTEDAQEVLPFTQRMAPGYSVGVDTRAETARAYGVVSLPTLVVVDKRGVVRDVAVGYTPGEDARLEDMVKALLQEPAPRE